MTPSKARIIRDATSAIALENKSEREPAQGVRLSRLVWRERLDAHEQGQKMLAEASTRSQEILAEARAQAQSEAKRVSEQASEDAKAAWSAAWIALRARAAREDEAAELRHLQIARLLAERLIRTQLRIAPETLVTMVREAIQQFWQAEQITVRGCVADIEILRAHAQELGIHPNALSLVVDETRDAGSVLLASVLGELDADVGLQLDRLVNCLRATIGSRD